MSLGAITIEQIDIWLNKRVEKNNKTYYPQVDGFRLILCILIVVYHLFLRYSELRNNVHFSKWFIPDAFSVVSLFFIISGYFLSEKNFRLYFKTKLVNVIIPFWISISLLLMVQIPFGFSGSLLDIGMNYLILPMMSGKFIYIDGAHWYIVTLTYYYVFYFILCKFSSLFKNKKDIILDLFLIIVSLLSLYSFFLTPYGILTKIIAVLFPRGLFFLVFGHFLKRLYSKTNFYTILLCIIFLLLSITITFSLSVATSVLFSILFVLLFMCFLGRCSFLELPFIVKLGKMTIWVYLLHEVLGFVLMDVLNELNSFFVLNSFIAFFVTFLFSLLVGWLYALSFSLFKKRKEEK